MRRFSYIFTGIKESTWPYFYLTLVTIDVFHNCSSVSGRFLMMRTCGLPDCSSPYIICWGCLPVWSGTTWKKLSCCGLEVVHSSSHGVYSFTGNRLNRRGPLIFQYYFSWWFSYLCSSLDLTCVFYPDCCSRKELIWRVGTAFLCFLECIFYDFSFLLLMSTVLGLLTSASSSAVLLDRCGWDRTPGRFLSRDCLRVSVVMLAQFWRGQSLEQCRYWSCFTRFESSQYPTCHLCRFDSSLFVFPKDGHLTSLPRSWIHLSYFNKSSVRFVFGKWLDFFIFSIT